MKAHFILYVSDQPRSTAFYSSVLGEAPVLDVPGMTEFRLAESAVLGLMPEAGIVALLGDAIVHPSSAHGAPRAELYLVVENAAAFHARAIASGAREVSPLTLREWGHSVDTPSTPTDTFWRSHLQRTPHDNRRRLAHSYDSV